MTFRPSDLELQHRNTASARAKTFNVKSGKERLLAALRGAPSLAAESAQDCVLAPLIEKAPQADRLVCGAVSLSRRDVSIRVRGSGGA